MKSVQDVFKGVIQKIKNIDPNKDSAIVQRIRGGPPTVAAGRDVRPGKLEAIKAARATNNASFWLEPENHDPLETAKKFAFDIKKDCGENTCVGGAKGPHCDFFRHHLLHQRNNNMKTFNPSFQTNLSPRHFTTLLAFFVALANTPERMETLRRIFKNNGKRIPPTCSDQSLFHCDFMECQHQHQIEVS